MLDRYERLHLQAVAARVHAEQDDQEQQGPVPAARRPGRAPRQAAHLLGGDAWQSESASRSPTTPCRPTCAGSPPRSCSTSSSHRGSWVVLFFYPGDFTFICPTELAAFARAPRRVPRARAPSCSRRARTAASATRPGSRPIRGSRTSAIPVIADSLRDAEPRLRRAARGRGDGSRHVHHRPRRRAAAHEHHRARRRPQRRRGPARPARVQDRSDVPRRLGAGRSDADEARTTGSRRCSPTSSARSSTRSVSAPSASRSPPATRSSPKATPPTASTSSRAGEVAISRRSPDGRRGQARAARPRSVLRRGRDPRRDAADGDRARGRRRRADRPELAGVPGRRSSDPTARSATSPRSPRSGSRSRGERRRCAGRSGSGTGCQPGRDHDRRRMPTPDERAQSWREDQRSAARIIETALTTSPTIQPATF